MLMSLGEDVELEEIRKRRLMELQQRLAQEQEALEAQKRAEMQRQAILRKILTPEARQRLANLRMVKPEFAAQLETQLIQLVQRGLLQIPIDDDQLKEILRRMQAGKREIHIRRI
ncbi:MAG: DNA-binding protein [Candidatus Bathyarchaeia archaeon]|nr:DNA-binding protein [Candidatus Bathyarchaeota archaeon]